jgi:hypothetical protein
MFTYLSVFDRLCGLVFRVPGYISRGLGFDSRRYQIYWEVVGLQRGPLSLVNTIEELLGRKGSGSRLEIRKYGLRDPLCWPRNTLYPQKLTLTSPTSGGRPVGIFRSRTYATEFFSFDICLQLFIILFFTFARLALTAYLALMFAFLYSCVSLTCDLVRSPLVRVALCNCPHI